MQALTKDRYSLLRRGLACWPVLLIVLSTFVHVATAQDAVQDVSPSEDVEGTPAAGGIANVYGQETPSARPQDISFWSDGPGRLAGAIPTTFKRHFVTRFSVGETYERGISNGERINSIDTNTNASLGFHYDLQRKNSEYTLDYFGAARNYHRLSRLNVVSHEAGLGQVVRWSPRVTTALRYRYSFTPDIAEYLLQETLAQGMSLMDPSAIAEPLVIPADQGLVTIRTVRRSSTAEANLAYQATNYTRLSMTAKYGRLRYQNGGLFGSESAVISAQLEQALTPRTAVGIGYDGRWFHQPGGLDRTLVHSGNLSFFRKLTQYATLRLSVGRLWSYSDGRDISLSPVLADILGTQTLTRRDSRHFASWTGSAELLTHWQWRKVNLSLAYGRSITNNNLLGSPANTQSLTMNIGRLFGRSNTVSGSLIYQRSDLFTLQDSRRLDQGVAMVSFSRPLFAGLDVSMFFNYSKLFRGVEEYFRVGHIRSGMNISYQFPRLRPS
jgi:hypothetical protein